MVPLGNTNSTLRNADGNNHIEFPLSTENVNQLIYDSSGFFPFSSIKSQSEINQPIYDSSNFHFSPTQEDDFASLQIVKLCTTTQKESIVEKESHNNVSQNDKKEDNDKNIIVTDQGDELSAIEENEENKHEIKESETDKINEDKDNLDNNNEHNMIEDDQGNNLKEDNKSANDSLKPNNSKGNIEDNNKLNDNDEIAASKFVEKPLKKISKEEADRLRKEFEEVGDEDVLQPDDPTGLNIKPSSRKIFRAKENKLPAVKSARANTKISLTKKNLNEIRSKKGIRGGGHYTSLKPESSIKSMRKTANLTSSQNDVKKLFTPRPPDTTHNPGCF